MFDVELYNSSYEFINELDVSMVIIDGSGKEFNFIFNKMGWVYSLNVGFFFVGNYNYKVNVFSNGENLSFFG